MEHAMMTTTPLILPPREGSFRAELAAIPVAFIVLTTASGMVDAVTFLALGHVFVANMTGNVVFLGFAAAGERDISATGSLAALAAFVVGSFAGGALTARSRSTAASPERVWSVWCDPSNWSRWNTGIRSATIDGPLVSGATGTMVTTRGSTHPVTFADVVPDRGFTMSTGGPPGTTMTFICEIVPNGSGSTISQSVALAGPLAFLWGPLMGAQMANHFVPVLDDLARAAEAI